MFSYLRDPIVQIKFESATKVYWDGRSRYRSVSRRYWMGLTALATTFVNHCAKGIIDKRPITMFLRAALWRLLQKIV